MVHGSEIQRTPSPLALTENFKNQQNPLKSKGRGHSMEGIASKHETTNVRTRARLTKTCRWQMGGGVPLYTLLEQKVFKVKAKKKRSKKMFFRCFYNVLCMLHVQSNGQLVSSLYVVRGSGSDHGLYHGSWIAGLGNPPNPPPQGSARIVDQRTRNPPTSPLCSHHAPSKLQPPPTTTYHSTPCCW